MKTKAVIGIDPGMSKSSPGCAALWAENNCVAFYDWQGIAGAAKNILCWRDRFEIVSAGIEKVLSHPNNGHRQAFLFGENFGIWQGILTAAGIDFDLIDPKEWRRVIPPIYRGTTKDQSIAAAKALIPGVERFIRLKRHNGRADAILICFYLKDRVKIRDMIIR